MFSDSDFDIVKFDESIHSRIKVRLMYLEQGLSSFPEMFGRRAVLDRLLNALDFLQPDYGFLIYDVYRPRAVQARLFDWMRNEVRKRSPDLNDQQNYDEARKYASPPSKVGDVYCPPHLSGGAIDLTLCDIVTGKVLEMGTPFDDCTEKSHSNYFDLKSPLTPEEKNIKENRDLLGNSMKKVGFVPHQYEWWHFDLGNILWSHSTGFPAVFGPLFGDEEWLEASNSM